MKDLLARYKASHLGRTLTRYGERNGAVLAGGVAYAALFSVFGALAAAFSVFALVVGGNQEFFDRVVDAVGSVLPGLLTTSTSKGAIDPESLVQPDLFSTAGVIAFLTALFAGLGWVDALRNAIRAMFDLPLLQRNIAVTKLLDVVWLASLGLALLASAVVSIAFTSLGGILLDWLHLDGSLSRGLIRVLGFVVVVLVEAALLWIIYVWLAGLKLPLVRLRGPLLVGGAMLAVLTQFSGVFVGSAGTRNPLLATGAVLVTILVLLNFISRLVLYVASWLATADDPAQVLEAGPVPAVDLDKALGVPRTPVTISQRAQDRTVLAAGVVLGAGLAVAGRVLREGALTLARLARRG